MHQADHRAKPAIRTVSVMALFPHLRRVIDSLATLGASGAAANAESELAAVRSAEVEVDALVARIAHTQVQSTLR